ncbi:hypothetical protein Tco_0598843 [Tanacetum coccineum]
MERQHSQADVAKMIADAIQQERENLRAEISSTSAIHPRDQDDPHDDAHPEGRIVLKGRRRLSMEPMFLEIHHLVDKYVKKFNPYARYSIEHLKNPHAKFFYIKRQKEPGKPKEKVYSNSKTVQVIKIYGELGHEHKFVIEIIARRANCSIVPITEPNYKNLNKNDIEDMYLLCINDEVGDYAKTRLVWSLSVFIKSTVIWERVHDFQLGVESYQQKVNLTAPHQHSTFPGHDKEKECFLHLLETNKWQLITRTTRKKKRVEETSKGFHKFW